MDASLYTLVGALGGVLLTQVSNYFLESKKGKNSQESKRLELEQLRKHDLFKERRIAYTKYLEEFDHYVNGSNFVEKLMNAYYAALILSSKETSTILIASLNYKLDGEMQEIMDCKKNLYLAMQKDLEI